MDRNALTHLLESIKPLARTWPDLRCLAGVQSPTPPLRPPLPPLPGSPPLAAGRRRPWSTSSRVISCLPHGDAEGDKCKNNIQVAYFSNFLKQQIVVVFWAIWNRYSAEYNVRGMWLLSFHCKNRSFVIAGIPAVYWTIWKTRDQAQKRASGWPPVTRRLMWGWIVISCLCQCPAMSW